MRIEDFVPQTGGHLLLNYWLCKEPLISPIGQFEISLIGELDQEIVDCTSLIAGFVAENYADIHELVYANYLRVCEDKYWMKSCGVPRGLRYDRVIKYIQSRSIDVMRARDQSVKGSIFFIPKWDIEHGIH